MSAEHESHSVAPVTHGRGVYWLPNLFTTGTLFGGFYAVVAAIDGNFGRAGIGILIAMVFDGLDGRVARWTNTQSQFGKEYDSLCDMVAFGLAPAIVAYQWGIERIAIADYGIVWERFGWLAAFFYTVGAGLRLARFNSRASSEDKKYFEGLPSPSAAAVVASFIWLASKFDVSGLPALILGFVITICAGSLMVSRFSYWSGKELDVRARIPWVYAALIPLIYIVISLSPESLFVLFGTYALSAPAQWVWRRLRRRRRHADHGS